MKILCLRQATIVTNFVHGRIHFDTAKPL